MSVRHALPLSIGLLALSFASGCTIYERPATTEAMMVPASGPDVAPPAPAGDQVWVDSYQRWDGHGYVVERGHYERRPHRDARFVRGHWERRGHRRVWIESHWE